MQQLCLGSHGLMVQSLIPGQDSKPQIDPEGNYLWAYWWVVTALNGSLWHVCKCVWMGEANSMIQNTTNNKVHKKSKRYCINVGSIRNNVTLILQLRFLSNYSNQNFCWKGQLTPILTRLLFSTTTHSVSRSEWLSDPNTGSISELLDRIFSTGSQANKTNDPTKTGLNYKLNWWRNEVQVETRGGEIKLKRIRRNTNRHEDRRSPVTIGEITKTQERSG